MASSLTYMAEKRVDGIWTPMERPSQQGGKDDAGHLWQLFGKGGDAYAIVPLRGLPPDASEPARGFANDNSSGQSWCTLEELLAYDWNRLVPLESYLLEKDVLRWNPGSRPSQEALSAGLLTQLGSTKAKPVVKAASIKELEALKKSPGFDVYAPRLVLARWKEPLSERLPYFHGVLLPYLQTIASPLDVRLIVSYFA